MNPKEQKLIDALVEADCKLVEAYHKRDEAKYKWDETGRKWAEAYRKLWKYRENKAQQGGKAEE